MPKQSEIAPTIREFISENFLFRESREALSDAESLIGANIIDSTGVLELVFFLESTFGIALADSDIVPANLDSIGAITAFVSSKRGLVSAV